MHQPGGPTDRDHDKHLQLGADLTADDRDELGPDEIDDVWANATTVEQFRADIEALAGGG